MGPASRFPTAAKFRSSTGLAPRASETGQTDRKGQPMSKAGNRLLRTTLIRAADNARRQDPQLARIYHTQMVQRGNDHLGAVCVVAAHLAERAWVTLDRGMPYVVCDTDGTPVTPPRPRPSSTSTGPCPRRSAAGGAASRGRPLTKSSPDMRKVLKAQRGGPPLTTQSWTATRPRQASPTTSLTTKPP
jgi:Transposase IS116/IS110/IS902 family